MSNKKQNIIVAIIGYIVTISIIAVAIVSLNFFKDVPVSCQHIFGHDLDSYKIFAYWMIGIIGVILFVVTSLLAFYDKKDNEAK
jgi:uncharacterized membrane protein